MFSYILRRVFGTSNERIVKSLQPIIDKINGFEPALEKLSDEELAGKTAEFKRKLADGASLDSLLPEAFAVVREASKRTLKMRHFDVQLIGGIIMHRGMIAEMKTGEGKTLAATLPVYLNALLGKGAHVITVNDYLVKRDAKWMGQIYNFLGMSVGCVTNDVREEDKQAAYNADITYGTNNEFGFDYLRDNLKYHTEHMVQREFHFAIVDEVDSILIDEARTPLIISGPAEDSSEMYFKIDKIIPLLAEDDYEIDEKARTAYITDKGNETVEQLLKKESIIAPDNGLFDYENMTVVHHVNQALKAHKLFKRDVDYIIKEGKVMIIDEFTGRIMDGRRYSEGLHQALEAKEKVSIQNENQTLASVTFQNYFRMYPKLAGMTGTAMTEADEFADIYKLEVVAIPTNIPVTRKDEDDEIYLTAEEKYSAIVQEIEKFHEIGQPVLVGTVSIEKSEYIANLLKKHKIKHNVLNARYHEQEAEIIAQAGRIGTVTIATNMAGRGTDIMLGGNPEMLLKQKLKDTPNATEEQKAKMLTEVKAQVEADKARVIELGGLLIIGTERHESRRIDNQLRGRSGRQGDPGKTKFYLSMEDDLMRIFGSDKIKSLLSRLGLKEGEAIVHPWISKSLEKAQQKVEARNYDIRKSLLRFDDVMNDQRKAIYDQRKFIMKEEVLRPTVQTMAEEVSSDIIQAYIPLNSLPEEWDTENLSKEFFRIFGIHIDFKELAGREGIANEEIVETANKAINELFEHKFSQYGEELLEKAIRQTLLLTLDHLWKEHLHTLDHLRTGIGLRAYAQKDPLNEYKIEAFNLFGILLDDVAELSVGRIAHLEITREIDNLQETKRPMFEVKTAPTSALVMEDGTAAVSGGVVRPMKTHISVEERNATDPQTWGKIARNENCPCGSGKKYKYCHGTT
jgi:preprotein translocase subunit SecA